MSSIGEWTKGWEAMMGWQVEISGQRGVFRVYIPWEKAAEIEAIDDGCDGCTVSHHVRDIIAAAPALAEALADVLALMDEGKLVRDTRGDGKPGWAIEQLDLVRRLKNADTALRLAKGEQP